jgi:hypothetical protein
MEQTMRSTAYDIKGPCEAFTIVLVHGVSWTRKMWIPQLEALSDEFQVIAPDLPGHGVRCKQPFRLKNAVQAVMESLRQQTHDRALRMIHRRLLGWCCLAPVLIIVARLASSPGSIVPLPLLSFLKIDSAACRKKLLETCFQKL